MSRDYNSTLPHHGLADHCPYEELVGRTVHKTTIYRLLERHQWRKIVPRQSHPKADPKEQEAFKKTSLGR